MTGCGDMDLVVKKRPDSPNEWNHAVSSFEEGSFFQSTHWGDYLDKYKGYRTYYVSLEKDGEMEGMALLWSEDVKFKNIPLSSRAFSFYGPLLRDYNDENLHIFLSAFDKICKENRIVMLERLSLPMHFRPGTKYDAFKNSAILKEKGYSGRKWATILVDLRKDENELEEALEYSAKKCINKNKRDKIEVTTVKDPAEYEKYCLLMYDFMRMRRNRLPYFTPPMWLFLRNKEKCMEIFVAKQGTDMQGGLGILYFNGIVFEIAAWRSDHAIKNNLYIGDAIKWEVIRWAKKNGHSVYDLGGVNPNPSTDKERGIKRFKEKWGGSEIVYPEYSKVYKKASHHIYEKMKKVYSFGKELV